MDFAFNNASFAGAPSWVVSIQTRVEGGNLPPFAEGQLPMLRFTGSVGARMLGIVSRIDVPIDAASVTLPGMPRLPTAEFRVSIQNLPRGFEIHSLTFGALDLTKSVLVLGPSSSSTTTAKEPLVLILKAPAEVLSEPARPQ
jgi:hypothetical protein